MSKKLILFIAVGFYGLVIDLSCSAFVLTWLKEIWGHNSDLLTSLSRLAGFGAAIFSTYLANRSLTWWQAKPASLPEFKAYIRVSLVAMLISLGVSLLTIALLTTPLELEASIVLGSAIAAIYNFFGYSKVFEHHAR